MPRCDKLTKKAVPEKSGSVDVWCIVPTLANGKHIDGNPDHYNGSSHWGPSGWVRGS